MPSFDRTNSKALREYLYYSNIHDAELKALHYNGEENILTIEAFNLIFDQRISFTFENITALIFVNSSELGNRRAIASLTIEEDYSYTKSCAKRVESDFVNSLCLLFQMFSGDELHIVAGKVCVEVVNTVQANGSTC